MKNSAWGRRIVAGLIVSVCVSSAVAIFLVVLDAISSIFLNYSFLVFFLPMAGILLAWIKTKNFFSKLETNHEIERELRNPEKPISNRLAPAVVLMSWWSHLFGASVGREMVAVQVGASISDAL